MGRRLRGEGGEGRGEGGWTWPAASLALPDHSAEPGSVTEERRGTGQGKAGLGMAAGEELAGGGDVGGRGLMAGECMGRTGEMKRERESSLVPLGPLPPGEAPVV